MICALGIEQRRMLLRRLEPSRHCASCTPIDPAIEQHLLSWKRKVSKDRGVKRVGDLAKNLIPVGCDGSLVDERDKNVGFQFGTTFAEHPQQPAAERKSNIDRTIERHRDCGAQISKAQAGDIRMQEATPISFMRRLPTDCADPLQKLGKQKFHTAL